MNAKTRVMAVARKEWRLNLRFPAEYFIHNLVSPVKSAILMIFIYSGFFKTAGNFGNMTKENFIAYVLLGSILHSQLTTSIGIFRGKLVMEKYWQTAMATLLSPASIYEVLAGYALGSGGISFLVNIGLLSAVTFVWPVSAGTYLLSLFVLFLMALLGFGLGLIGATIGLCYEGKSFAFDYGVQLITFLSCFYYPVEILPKVIKPFVTIMPTYQLGEALHNFYLSLPVGNVFLSVAYMLVTIFLVVFAGGALFDYSIRKQGVIGY